MVHVLRDGVKCSVNGWNVRALYRHTCFVQEFQILDSREELVLRLRGAPTDLEVGRLKSCWKHFFVLTFLAVYWCCFLWLWFLNWFSVVVWLAVNALFVIISAKWKEWNWRIYCFHFCVSVCLSVCLYALWSSAASVAAITHHIYFSPPQRISRLPQPISHPKPISLP